MIFNQIILKTTIYDFFYLIYNIMEREKIEIKICLSKEILDKINEITTGKSWLVERLLFEYLKEKRIEINDIVL